MQMGVALLLKIRSFMKVRSAATEIALSEKVSSGFSVSVETEGVSCPTFRSLAISDE
jgi:hypothetical protein